jgi:hypothetical protein
MEIKDSESEYALTLEVNWAFEKYFYSNIFRLDKIGLYQSKILLNEKELETPKFLYKFFNDCNHNLDSLLEPYLYFSSPRNFNDPFDCITNREKYIFQGGEGIVSHRNNIGVCCFSLTPNNPLMWGHYTNNYNGYCIKYQNNQFLNTDEIDIRTHVSYLKDYMPANDELRERISEIESAPISDDSKDFIKKILVMLFEYCWKYYDWIYEKEYRAISFNSEEFNRKLKFDNNVISEVYIGHKLKKHNESFFNLLMNILKEKYSHAKIYQVEPNPLRVKLDFNEIEV